MWSYKKSSLQFTFSKLVVFQNITLRNKKKCLIPHRQTLGYRSNPKYTKSTSLFIDLNCDSEPQNKQRQAAFNHMVQGCVPIQVRVKEIKNTFQMSISIEQSE